MGMKQRILSVSTLGFVALAMGVPIFSALAARVMPHPSCMLPSILPLDSVRDRDLRKLASFQSSYGSVGRSLSFFTSIPMDLETDLGEAEGVAAKLKAFAAAGVTPVVFAEPPVERSLADIADGVSPVYWEEYFQRIRSMGVTDGQMGLWIPYPEINTPIWNREWFSPTDFPRLVHSFSVAYKKVFPTAKAGILLNSFSYEPTDVGWEHGRAVSYLPYVQGIAPGNVDVVGIQAFPWFPRKNEDKKALDSVSKFLFMKWAVEAANAVGTKGIMVHTGVPRSMHEGAATKVIVPLATRERIMRQIGTLVATYERLGYDMSLSLFLEDKSGVEEGTDWSFDASSAHVMKRIAKTAHCNGIPLVLY